MLQEMNVTPTIGVRDLSVAGEFYEKKLGLKLIDKPNEYVRHYQSGNGKIEIYKSDFAGTNKATAMTWTVGDKIDEEVKTLRSKGIIFEHYQLPEVKLEGDIHVMKDMKAAWFKDPDGNVLCIHDH